MALILQNATFKDSEGLIKLIELFNRESITAHALSTELSLAAQDVVAFGNEVCIEIVEGKGTDKSFGIAILPKPSMNKMDLYFYIDKKIFSMLSAVQVLDAILLMLSNYTRVTMEFAKFNAKTFDADLDLVDALIEALKLYKISLEIFKELPNLDQNSLALVCPHGIDEAIDSLEKDHYTVEQAKELVVIKNCLPEKIIEAAENIVKNNKEIFNKEDRIVRPGSRYSEEFPEVPTVDKYFNRIKELTDNTYPMYQPREIDPDYLPETNQ